MRSNSDAAAGNGAEEQDSRFSLSLVGLQARDWERRLRCGGNRDKGSRTRGGAGQYQNRQDKNDARHRAWGCKPITKLGCEPFDAYFAVLQFVEFEGVLQPIAL